MNSGLWISFLLSSGAGGLVLRLARLDAPLAILGGGG